MKTNWISVGGSNYITHIEQVGNEEYREYVEKIKKEGFQVYAENAEGFDDNVYCTTLEKEGRIIHVTFFKKAGKISVSVYEGTLPTHLHFRQPEISENPTKLHMMELFRLGNSFVFQLKNGHFVISDGGLAADLPYLLDYLESLVSKDEKPIVEGWFITHAHGDHCGALCEFTKHPEWMERIQVDEIYYSEPNEKEILWNCGCEVLTFEIKWTARRLNAKFCRPQTGQRYYFEDMTVDVLLAQEQVPFGKFRSDLNTSSTVCMFTVDGQKLLFSGDIQEEGLEWMMNQYSKDYLTVDFFTLNHHGMNLSREFAEYATAKVMLLTVRGDVPIRNIRETKTMITKASESVVWGDGTKVFTFPYVVGTYETLPLQDWRYHEGQERLPQRNLYTCRGKLLQGWIFDADRILFDGEELREGAEQLIQYLKEQNVRLAAFSRACETKLEEKLKCLGLENYFDLLLGGKTYLAMAQRAEEQFQLGHIYKYIVVTDDYDVVNEVIKDGFKTLVPKNGRELEAELKEKCWHTFEDLNTIYDFFELKNIYFKEKYEGDLG